MPVVSQRSYMLESIVNVAGPLSQVVGTFMPYVVTATPVAAVALSFTGYRVGPGRALGLAFRSSRLSRLLWWSKPVVSQRHDEARDLLELLQTLAESCYIVIRGDKGVGKTRLIESALVNRCGVVRMSVSPGAKKDDIVKGALHTLLRSKNVFSFIDPLPNARRVLWVYSFLSSTPPTLVMAVDERQSTDEYAGVTSSVRILADLGINVIVDASPNSLPDETLTTNREIVMDVDLMPRNMVLSDPQFKALFDRLKSAGVNEVAWQLLGGNPAVLVRLASTLPRRSEKEGDDKEVARLAHTSIEKQVANAIKSRFDLLTKHPKLEPLLEDFKTRPSARLKRLVELGHELPSPCKVLRKVYRGGKWVLVPSTPAMAFVLRHDLEEVPPPEQLHELIKLPPLPDVESTSTPLSTSTMPPA